MAYWAASTVSKIGEWAPKIGELVGSSVVDNLVSTAYSYLRIRILPVDTEADLKRLQTTLPQIKAVMDIAEALMMKDPRASLWVDQLRKAVEASEVVLDELENKERNDAGGSASSSKKRKRCSINGDTLKRLKESVTMLDRAADSVKPLLQAATLRGIRDISESQQKAGKSLRRETSCFLAETDVVGRNVEKDNLIGWLKQPTNALLSSFGIVGVGGQGKSTLVQFAYQEILSLKEKQFDETIWVSISSNFSVEEVTRKMLGETSSCGKPLNALQETLKKKIHLKKILLVLDDVCNDEKRSDWEQLVAPLRFVKEESKIIFTTRKESVKNLLVSVISPEHQSLVLQGLKEEELRLLFNSYVFRGFNIDNHRDLQIIGKQILQMLRGSPLAAKVIGNLLNSEMNHHHWSRVLNRMPQVNLEQEEDMLEVLKFNTSMRLR